jgi:hypothetical protein
MSPIVGPQRKSRPTAGNFRFLGIGRQSFRAHSPHAHCQGSPILLNSNLGALFWSVPMPMVIDIRLIGFSGDFTEPVPKEGIQITGSLLFFRYHNGFEFEGQDDIFSFPKGPLTIPNGRGIVSPPAPTKSFTLGTSLDPATFTSTVQFGGSLHSVNTQTSFGTQWRFETRETVPRVELEVETVRVLRFVGGEQEIRVDIGLKTTQVF